MWLAEELVLQKAYITCWCPQEKQEMLFAGSSALNFHHNVEHASP
jgi:hypothetical protein